MLITKEEIKSYFEFYKQYLPPSAKFFNLTQYNTDRNITISYTIGNDNRWQLLPLEISDIKRFIRENKINQIYFHKKSHL